MMRIAVQIVIGLCLIFLISSCALIVLQSPQDEVAVFAYAYPEEVGSGPQTYAVYVVITRGDRTYNNAEVRMNGVEMLYQEYTYDQDNGYYSGSLNNMSQGDNISLEVGFFLLGSTVTTLQIPYGIPEITVDPALPEPGVAIDPDTGPSGYDVTVSSIPPENAFILTWVDSYDINYNYITGYSDIPENGLSQYVNGPVLDVNGNCYPYLVFSAQYLVYSAVEDWHPDSGFFVYGSMAPWVTNLDSVNNRSIGLIGAPTFSTSPVSAQ